MDEEIWIDPGRQYRDRAMEELGLTIDDLEEPVDGPVHFGVHPNIEAVYRRAWQLRMAQPSTAGSSRRWMGSSRETSTG